MKILMISTLLNYFVDDTASFPRLYNFLDQLRNKHEVIVLQPLRQKGKEKPELIKHTKIYYFQEFSIKSKTLWHFTDVFDYRFLFTVKKIVKIEKVDLIHLDFPYGGNLISLISMFTKIPVIYNSHNIEGNYYKEVADNLMEIPRLIRPYYWILHYLIEFFFCRRAKLTIAIQDIERVVFSKKYHIHQNKFVTVNNCVQNAYFNNPISKEEAMKALNLNPQKKYILFHGPYINANINAYDLIVKKIAPKLQNNPDIVFLLVGKTPKFTGSNIVCLGYVESLKHVLYAVDIAIVPLLTGAGVRTKIFDYLAASIPIISTSKGIEGIVLEEDKDYIKEDEIDNYPNQILKLLADPLKMKNFKKNMTKKINKYYLWKKSGLRLNYIYDFIYSNTLKR
jgi:glycosyltransferase involved in cell wall biosynthesis